MKLSLDFRGGSLPKWMTFSWLSLPKTVTPSSVFLILVTNSSCAELMPTGGSDGTPGRFVEGG